MEQGKVVAIERAGFTNGALVLRSDGKIWQWDGEGNAVATPPELRSVLDIRHADGLSAAKLANGRWYAWGDDTHGVVNRINSLGDNVVDLDFCIDKLFWIEKSEAGS